MNIILVFAKAGIEDIKMLYWQDLMEAKDRCGYYNFY